MVVAALVWIWLVALGVGAPLDLARLQPDVFRLPRVSHFRVVVVAVLAWLLLVVGSGGNFVGSY